MPDKQSDRQEVERLNQIRAILRQEDAISIAGSLGQLLMGVGVLFIVGFALTTIIVVSFFPFSYWWTAWWDCFLGYLLILTPLLIWYERRSRGDYLGAAAQSINPNPSSRGQYKVNQAIAGVGFVAELAVWGPRAVIDGVRGLRGLRTAGQLAVFDRASRLVLDLTQAHGGIEIKRLMHPPEDIAIFGLAVDLLDKHGCIGKSSDGTSLWLNSTWREKIKKAVS